LEDSYTVHLAVDWKIVVLIHLSYQPISVEEKKRNHLEVLVWYPRRLLDISFYLFQRTTKHADSLEDSYTVHLAADWKIVALIHLSY
jgi:hypothetical protein